MLFYIMLNLQELKYTFKLYNIIYYLQKGIYFLQRADIKLFYYVLSQ